MSINSTETTGKPGFRSRVATFFKRVWSAIAPDPVGWRGAGLGLALLTFILLALSLISANPRLPVPGIILTLLVALLGLLVSHGALPLLVRFYQAISAVYLRWLVWSVLIVVLLAKTIFNIAGTGDLVTLIGWTLLTGSLVGGGVALLVSRRLGSLSALKKGITLSGLAAGVVLLVLGVAWTLSDGTANSLPPDSLMASRTNAAPLNLPDPTLPGTYDVLTLTYGSGSDLLRREYGADADLITGTVDGTALVGNWSGVSGAARTAFWGFDATALPINARVWYPDGAGPFPLFVIVHGNHDMTEFSDTGYAYLGTHLASQGYIVVSVDENFLNSDGIADPILGELREENDLRGWLLLEHLRWWRTWNAMPDSPFYHRVDLARIAVGGHSRGGEAALIAAAFNHLPSYPGNANIAFDYGFDIRGVVALAPVDGQYAPMNQVTPLENVSYLMIQGGYDNDIVNFDGANVYDRVQFTTGDHFKALVWLAGANHGQFNTVWGRHDRQPGLSGQFLNTAPIMPGEAQQQAAQGFITAFLNATLKDETDYRALFRDPYTGSAWLPDTRYQTQYADSHTTFVSSYGEDLNATTTTLPGGRLAGENLTVWREQKISLPGGLRATSAAYLGWDRAVTDGAPVYKITLPENGLVSDLRSVLVMALAVTGEDANPDNLPRQATRIPGPENDSGGTDFTIELVDRAGESARLPLSDFAALQPPVSVRLQKTPFGSWSTMPVLQHVELPLSAFIAENPDFDPTAIDTVWLVFDRTPSAVVIVDDIGFRQE
ncbi:MAG: MFS transporter [Anaerolineaceae bacterium]|nr:MFS transporter [Anaerolineaceae bacterium]